MRFFRLKITAALLFFMFLCTGSTVSVFAQDASPSAKPTININIDPAVSARNKIYEETFAALSPAQQAKLQELDTMIVPTIDPTAAIKSAQAAVTMCHYPDIDDEQKQVLFENYRLHKTDRRFHATESLKQRMREIDFIDKDLLLDHIVYQATMNESMLMGLMNIVHSSGMTPDMCKDSMAEMQAAYEVPFTSRPILARVDSIGQKVVAANAPSCMSNYTIQVSDKESISLVILYRADSKGLMTTEYSAKIRKGATNNFDTLQTAHLNFDGMDTRDIARTSTAASGRTFIGVMKADHIIAVMNSLRDGKTVVSVDTERWDKPYSAYVPTPKATQLDEFASCIASISPQMKTTLRDHGYSTILAVNTKHVGRPL